MGIIRFANGSTTTVGATLASNATLESATAIQFRARLRVDQILALASFSSAAYKSLAMVGDGSLATGFQKFDVTLQPFNASFFRVVTAAGQGGAAVNVTTILTLAYSVLPARGNFVRIYGHYDPTASAGDQQRISVYSDGSTTALGSTGGSSTSGLITGSGHGSVRIGQAKANVPTAWEGGHDLWAWYANRIETTDAARQALPTTGDTGIVTLHDFTEGSGTSSVDSVSGGNNNLTLTSAAWGPVPPRLPVRTTAHHPQVGRYARFDGARTILAGPFPAADAPAASSSLLTLLRGNLAAA
jgi:hypothetical protein